MFRGRDSIYFSRLKQNGSVDVLKGLKNNNNYNPLRLFLCFFPMTVVLIN